MKLLLVDKNDFTTLSRAQLLDEFGHHKVDVVHSYDAVQSCYEKNKYHIVVIDFSIPSGIEAIRWIEQIDAMQRIVTISNSESYSELRGCRHCVEHHRRRRLKKPFAINTLVELIREFDLISCEHYHESD